MEVSNLILRVIALIENLIKNAAEVLSSPSTSFALLGVFIIICLGNYARRKKFTVHTLMYISLMLAFTVILHQIRLYHLPQGGSITVGSMIPILLLSYRYGVGTGALAGFLYGLINILQDPFILHPIQVLFDYPLPYMSLGLAALMPEHKMISTGIAFLCRFACHLISGVIFFSSYAPAGISPIIYSLTVNATFMLPECLICFLILKILPLDRLLNAMDKSQPR